MVAGRSPRLRRGAIFWVEFDPARGGEIRKRRPAIVVSNDAANVAANRVQVVPTSSNVSRIHSWEAPVRVSGRPGKALADQIRTVAKERLLDHIGDVTMAEMQGIERAIKLQLALT
jgi:mRNA interferase MazF